MARALVSLAALLGLLAACSASPAAIISANNEAQATVRALGIQSQIASRLYSLVHLAQYQAIEEGAEEAVQAAQAAYAGHAVLKQLFPWRFASYDKALKPLIADLSEEQRTSAEKVGRDAAIEVLTASLRDNFDRYVPFTPAANDSAPGLYQFTPNQTYSVYPQIAQTKPVVLSSVTEFKPAPPNAIGSPEYVADLAEVFVVGRKDSSNRTQEQTDTANFWADGNTTSAVAGHFNQIAQVLLSPNATVEEAALLFAVLNAAQWDASISAYTAKYANPSWRPITAITQGDGSQETAAYVDKDWRPLLNTPNHPEHPSGHSATAGASGAVLAEFFGADTPFEIGTEFPGLVPRTYASVQEAVEEVNDSRVFGGVHFRHAVEEGAKLGAAVAQAVISEFDSKVKKSN
ncbi:PAP2 superfamily [Chlorella sorokiniana]|uniref:PAP2 superfamily n=1 Tax=Chlorella sorokiniana TaxID=3076 RepID=A0A2P6U296_CHLSO|nr:PAP2 superfamily [Chlorella sorokiniana]|eukprot:PRW60432.1 PAP2 superfamily [Chlorella sorokiniana]